MFVLIVTRKGDTQRVVTSYDQEELKHLVERWEPTAVSWQDFGHEVGAHSPSDGEKTYSIHVAETI